MTRSDEKVVNIEKSSIESDLGIVIDSGLTFSEHIHSEKKANGIMAVIRRSYNCQDISCFSMLYKALVRPHLEFRVTIWFPYKVKDIEVIEKVQKRATKQVKQIRRLCYSKRLKVLNLPTLHYRRHRADMIIEVYKILHTQHL